VHFSQIWKLRDFALDLDRGDDLVAKNWQRSHVYGSGDILTDRQTDRHRQTDRCTHHITCNRSRGRIIRTTTILMSISTLVHVSSARDHHVLRMLLGCTCWFHGKDVLIRREMFEHQTMNLDEPSCNNGDVRGISALRFPCGNVFEARPYSERRRCGSQRCFGTRPGSATEK